MIGRLPAALLQSIRGQPSRTTSQSFLLIYLSRALFKGSGAVRAYFSLARPNNIVWNAKLNSRAILDKSGDLFFQWNCFAGLICSRCGLSRHGGWMEIASSTFGEKFSIAVWCTHWTCSKASLPEESQIQSIQGVYKRSADYHGARVNLNMDVSLTIYKFSQWRS